MLSKIIFHPQGMFGERDGRSRNCFVCICDNRSSAVCVYGRIGEMVSVFLNFKRRYNMKLILNKFFKKKIKTLKKMDQLMDIQKSIHNFNKENQTEIGLIQMVDSIEGSVRCNPLAPIADVIMLRSGEVIKNRFC